MRGASDARPGLLSGFADLIQVFSSMADQSNWFVLPAAAVALCLKSFQSWIRRAWRHEPGIALEIALVGNDQSTADLAPARDLIQSKTPTSVAVTTFVAAETSTARECVSAAATDGRDVLVAVVGSFGSPGYDKFIASLHAAHRESGLGVRQLIVPSSLQIPSVFVEVDAYDLVLFACQRAAAITQRQRDNERVRVRRARLMFFGVGVAACLCMWFADALRRRSVRTAVSREAPTQSAFIARRCAAHLRELSAGAARAAVGRWCQQVYVEAVTQELSQDIDHPEMNFFTVSFRGSRLASAVHVGNAGYEVDLKYSIAACAIRYGQAMEWGGKNGVTDYIRGFSTSDDSTGTFDVVSRRWVAGDGSGTCAFDYLGPADAKQHMSCAPALRLNEETTSALCLSSRRPTPHLSSATTRQKLRDAAAWILELDRLAQSSQAPSLRPSDDPVPTQRTNRRPFFALETSRAIPEAARRPRSTYLRTRSHVFAGDCGHFAVVRLVVVARRQSAATASYDVKKRLCAHGREKESLSLSVGGSVTPIRTAGRRHAALPTRG